MKKQIFIAIIIVAIAIIAISGFYVLSNSLPARITITYYSTHGTENVTANEYPLIDKIGYNGTVTWVQFYLNATSTKDTELNLDYCSIKCGDTPLVIMDENSEIISVQKGQVNAGAVGFILEGVVTGNFELTCNLTNVNVK